MLSTTHGTLRIRKVGYASLQFTACLLDQKSCVLSLSHTAGYHSMMVELSPGD